MTVPKKTYVPPRLGKHSLSSLPEHLRNLVDDLSGERRFTVVVDYERRHQSVPSDFASLLGYGPDELHGKRIDDITVRNSVDIDLIFQTFRQVGEMDGLWLFEHREGRMILFHYRARCERELLYAELQPMALAS